MEWEIDLERFLIRNFNTFYMIIISIGNELLYGKTVNTNASFIAEQLFNIGIEVEEVITIGDNKEDIEKALNQAFETSNWVIITGGLGPTKDDITKKVIADYFDCSLVMDQPTLERITEMYRRRGTQITEVNRRQAEIPEKGIALRNDHGTAPGIWIEEGEKVAVILPGVPFEMKAIMIEEVIPLIEKKRNKNQVVIHKEIVTAGIGESALSDLIESWELALPGHITLAYLPTPGKLMLRLTGRGNKAEKELLDQELEQQLDLLIQLVPQYIISTKNESIVEVISKKIIKKGQKLAVAESCTGGFLAHQITLLPGASRFFEGGIVSYSNTIKREILNVREINLKKHGAVSEFVVIDMAMNTMNLFDVDYAIAISGIVGPTGGTPEKPVGTAWIAVASPTKTVTQQVNYGTQGGREVIIQRIAGAALYLLYQQLQ